MIYYWIFVIFCLMIFIFHHWFTGHDLDRLELFAMLVTAAFPIANIGVLIVCLVDLLFRFIGKDGVLLKGRK